MKELIKKTIFKSVKNKPAFNLLHTQSIGAKVLFYHGIENKIVNPFVQSLHIPFDVFEKQIQYLRGAYEIVSLNEIHDAFSKGYKICSKHVALTFDDGYKNNVEIVFPFLDSLNIPFSVFICTKHIDSGDRFPTYILRAGLTENKKSKLAIKFLDKKFDISSDSQRAKTHEYLGNIIKTASQDRVDVVTNEILNSIPQDRWLEINHKYSSDQPMDWDDIEKLNNSGVTIGSHCHDHFIAHSNQTNDDIDQQLRLSKTLIDEKCGTCNYFCYPNGGFEDVSKYSHEKVQNIYNLCFTTSAGEVTNSCDRYYLPRYGAVSDLDHFKFNMTTSFIRNKTYEKIYKEFILNGK